MKKNNILLMAVLSLVFASCDNNNELENKELAGKDVPVRIRSMSIAEGGSESLGRSFSQREPQIVTRPIGDGMLLEMSIKEDESPLRATVLLGNGKLFRVIAVEHGSNKYYSHGDFTVGASGPSNDFLVRIGEKYDYICISYNSDTDLPPSTGYTVGAALSTSFSVDNTNDLLLCRINKNENVPSTGVELDILLEQKLSKVTLTIDCDYNDWDITAVATDAVAVMGTPLSCTIDWDLGTLTGTATEQFLTWPTPSTYNTNLTSNELRLVPATTNAVVRFLPDAISRDGYALAIPSAQRDITFASPLSAGVNYTILIRLRTPIWARSNIYWNSTGGDTGYLTFVPADANDDTKQGYQGVFFKWGSLVGISPAETEDPGLPGTKTQMFIYATPVYVPTYDPDYPTTGSSWLRHTSHSYTTLGWDDTAPNTAEDDADNIPYIDGRNAFQPAVYGRDDNYLMGPGRNDATMYQNRRGDICQYLSAKTGVVSGNYRLPTSNECGVIETGASWNASTINSDGWKIGGGTFLTNLAAGADDGTTDLLSDGYGSGINRTMEDVVFPASGNRFNNGGALGLVGEEGLYWVGSAFGGIYAYSMHFTQNIISPGNANTRSYALPVRCVLDK
jgi:hypothetical protein